METDLITITKDDLILRGDPAIPSQLPRLCDEKRNALIDSAGRLNVEIAEGTPRFCVPECNLMSLKGPDAQIFFTRLVVHQPYVHALMGSYYPDLGGDRLKSTALTVHAGHVNHLIVNDLHMTSGQLEVAVSGIVSHGHGNGKIVGPKITDFDQAKGWGRGWLTIAEIDPQITLEGNVKVGARSQRKLRDLATPAATAPKATGTKSLRQAH
jgi:hypothetical protein